MTLRYTPRLRLAYPDFLTSPWHSEFAAAMESIDRILYNAVIGELANTWENDHDYFVGDLVISPDDGTMYTCATEHNSSDEPQTLTQEIADHPEYWTPTTVVLATSEEAIEGVENTKYMSPLRTKEALSQLTQETFTDAPRSGRLTYQDDQNLEFKPWNGNLIKIDGLRYDIPVGGIAGLGNTGVWVDGSDGENLLGDTTYLVFAWVEDGVVTGDFRSLSTWSHGRSETEGNEGVEVLFLGAGEDSSRTLIGIVTTDGAGEFNDNDTERWVCSWFNQPARQLTNHLTTTVTTSSSTYINITEPTISWVQFAEDTTFLTATLVMFSASAARNDMSIRVDGNDRDTWNRIRTSNYSTGGTVCLCVTEAEGLHEAWPVASSIDSVSIDIFAYFDDLGGRPTIQAMLAGRG